MDLIRFLTEQVTQDIIAFLVDDRGIGYEQAIDLFYRSQTFEKLNDPATGLYRESAAYVYELYKSEEKNGVITQNEQ